MDSMDANSDIEVVEITIPRRVAPVSKKRKTARMCAGPGPKALLRRVTRAQIGSSAQSNTRTRNKTLGSKFKIQHMKGECPPFNDHFRSVEDTSSNKFYMIGGIRPGDPTDSPNTSDFYCLDMVEMKWVNLTDKLRRRVPDNPFSPQDGKTQQLPKLGFPACSFLQLNGRKFILIFGGFDVDKDESVSTLIAIDTDKLEWWYVNVHGGPVTPRIDPATVIVGTSLYIFGGYQRYGDDPLPCYSSSILKFNATSEPPRWEWEIIDVPYPATVPKDYAIGQGIPVYYGKQILLCPGRLTDDKPILVNQETMFLYNISRRTFKQLTAEGEFPGELSWYTLGNIANQEASFMVMLCGWFNVPDDEPRSDPDDVGDIAAELWRLSLLDEQIECLKISDDLLATECDLQQSILQFGHPRMIGYDDGGASNQPKQKPGRKRRYFDISDSDDHELGDHSATWNSYVEILPS